MKYLTTVSIFLTLAKPLCSWGSSDGLRLLNSATSNFSHLLIQSENRTKKLTAKAFLRNFSEWDKIKINKALASLEKVMNSERFKEEVLNFSFQGEKRFHRNKGMSNEEIYEHIMTGAEDLVPEIDRVMNFDLTLYRSLNPWSKAKGYTLPDTMRIWINTRYFRRVSWTIHDVAGNLVHEWIHKMGFDHNFNDNPDRDFTVPYGIGNIVKRLSKELNSRVSSEKFTKRLQRTKDIDILSSEN